MATFLEIGNKIATKAGLPVQTNLIGNSERNSARIAEAVTDGLLKDASRDVDWGIMRRPHTFTTDATAYYALPAGFDRIINSTLFDFTNTRSVHGPVGPTEWAQYTYRTTRPVGLQKIAFVDSSPVDNLTKVLRIWPDTDTGSVIKFMFITENVVLDVDGATLKTEFDADTDTTLIDRHVWEAAALYRLLRMMGLSYGDEQIEYEEMVVERKTNDVGGAEINIGVPAFKLGAWTPEYGYGS